VTVCRHLLHASDAADVGRAATADSDGVEVVCGMWCVVVVAAVVVGRCLRLAWLGSGERAYSATSYSAKK
jgi:hypothetical protein